MRCTRPRVLKTLALVVTVALGVQGCAGAARSDSDESLESREKSPFLAELLAIFPGILVHGLGNLYAGKTERAKELMGEEGLGIGALGIATALGFLGVEAMRHADGSSGAEEILGRIEEASSFLGCAGFAIFGAIFFFDSWIRDMIEAPSAAEQTNRELRRAYRAHPPVPEDRTPAPVTSTGSGTRPPSPPPKPPGKTRTLLLGGRR